MMNKRKVGSFFEDMAVKYLKENDYVILDRNYFTRIGEIDIIAKNEDYTCFIEVKYRSKDDYGKAIDAVDIKKQKKIYQVSKKYIFDKKLSYDSKYRFDVVSIEYNNDLNKENGEKYIISIYKNAFP